MIFDLASGRAGGLEVRALGASADVFDHVGLERCDLLPIEGAQGVLVDGLDPALPGELVLSGDSGRDEQVEWRTHVPADRTLPDRAKVYRGVREFGLRHVLAGLLRIEDRLP